MKQFDLVVTVGNRYVLRVTAENADEIRGLSEKELRRLAVMQGEWQVDGPTTLEAIDEVHHG